MKFTKLLVLGALLLAGGKALAADLIERVQPTNADISQVPVAFQAEETYLLYNTSAQLFFSQGNSWGTKASGHPSIEKANRMYFTKYVPSNGAWDGKTYIFKIYSSIRSDSYAWHECFFDSNSAMFVDRGSQANFYWEVEDRGNNVYRLKAAQANPSIKSDGTQYVGRDESVSQDAANLDSHYDNANAYPLSPMLQEGEGIHLDWVFYDASVFAKYEKSIDLKAGIEKTEKAGIDVAKWVAIYNDLNSTVAEMDAAIKEMDEARKNNLQNATGHFPQDASSWITNATFDKVGDFTGWTGNPNNFGAGGTTSTNAEHYNRNFNTYQDVTIQYPGLYLVSVNGFYRAGSIAAAYNHFLADDDDNKNTLFYATVGDVTADLPVVSIYHGAPTTKPSHGAGTEANGYWIPNSMADAEKYMHQNGLYANVLAIEVPAAGTTMRIGVKKDKTIDTDWAIFDDFSLTFCGAGDDRYYAYAKVLADASPEITATVVTKSYVDAYNAIKANPTGNSEEEVMAYVAQLDAALAEVNENIALWKEFNTQVETGMATYNKVAMIDDEAVAYLGAYLVGSEQDLADYIEMGWINGNAVVILKNVDLNNEQLREEIARLSALIADAKTVILPNTDVTDLLQNPDFTKNKEGWTGWGSATSGGNKGGHPTTGGSPNVCAEAYDANGFDLYQVVDGLSIGVYEVSVQGFTRIGRNDGSPHGAAWSNYVSTQGQAKMPVYIYLNDNTTNIKDCHDEPQTKDFYSDTSIANFIDATTGMLNNNVDSVVNDGYYPNLPEQIFVPNTMTGAGYAFQKGIYVNSAFGAVINKGDSLRLGIKGNTNGANWSIYDNFKLHFWGKQADKVLLALNSAIDDVENNQLKKNMTTDARAAINEALAAAKTSAQTEQADGDAMFDKLAALYKAKALIIDAEQQLNDLETAKDSLLTEWQNLTGNGATYPALLTEARDLANEVNRKLQTSNISKDEIDAYLVSLRAYKENVAVYAALVTAADKLDTAIGDLNYDYETMASSDEWVALKEEMTLVNDIKTRLADAEDADAKLPVEEAKTLTEKLNEYQKNVTKYADLQKALQELEDAIGNAEAEGITVPNEVNIQFAEITADFADGLIALEEIDAKIQLVRELITKINAPANIDLASDENPVDLTAMIKNPKFEKDGENATAGWLGLDGSGVSGGGDTQKYAYALEYYEKTFDLHQVLYGMPAGVYEVKAKGFYRFGSVENDYNIWWKEEKRDTANAFLYGMSLADSVRSSVPLKLISAGAVREQLKPEEGEELNENFINADGYIQGQSKYGVAENDTVYLPGSMLSAKYWFMHNDCYNNSVIFRLNEKGNLSIGVKESVSIGQNWVILDDFELWYYGANSAKQPADDPSGISSVASGDIVRSEYFNINGMRTIAPQKGIVIVRQTLSDGNVVVKKMNLK